MSHKKSLTAPPPSAPERAWPPTRPAPETLRFERCKRCGGLIGVGGALCTFGCRFDGTHVLQRPKDQVESVTYRLERGEPR